MERDTLRAEALNLLRFPLAIVIVAVHIFSSTITIQGESFSFANMPIFLGILDFIDAFLKGQSVPIYYFISGYVFFIGAELTIQKYKNKIKNRIKTLFLPYVIWNAIAVLFSLIFFIPALSHLSYTFSNASLNLSISSIFNCFWDNTNSIFFSSGATGLNAIYPNNYPLWFLRDLMLVVLSIPLVYPIIKKSKYYFVALLGIAWFVAGYSPEISRLDQILSAYFFFFLGAYFSINRIDMISSFGKLFKTSVLLYLLLGVIYMVLSGTEFDTYTWIVKRVNVIVGLFFAYNIAAWLLTKNICRPSKLLSSSSFFIYVSHAIISSYILKIIFKVVEPSAQYSVIFVYFVALVMVVLSLLGVYYILSKYLPSLLVLLTGRKEKQ